MFRSSFAPAILFQVMLLVGTLSPLQAEAGETGVMKELCQFQTLNITCGEDEVILMTTARYGRMRLGRCVHKDYGHIGCYVNVLGELDWQCSGKRTCQLSVSSLGKSVQPCPNDLTSYLTLHYVCVKVFHRCPTNSRLLHSTMELAQVRHQGHSQHVHISSAFDQHGQFASRTCPAAIRVSTGQRIALFVYNFGHSLKESPPRRVCPYRAVILDGHDRHNVSMCGRSRMTTLYMSKSHNVSLQFNFDTRLVATAKFLVYYETMGCADPELVPNTWLERNGDDATIRCNFTQQSWHLTCADNTWSGAANNCSAKMIPMTINGGQSAGVASFGALMAVTTGITIGIVVGAILLMSVLIYKRSEPPTRPVESADCLTAGPNNGPCVVQYGRAGPPCKRHPAARSYIHMMELRCEPCQNNKSADEVALYEARKCITPRRSLSACSTFKPYGTHSEISILESAACKNNVNVCDPVQYNHNELHQHANSSMIHTPEQSTC